MEHLTKEVYLKNIVNIIEPVNDAEMEEALNKKKLN